MNEVKNVVACVFVALSTVLSWSQNALDMYIKYGLDSNLVLKQRTIQLDKAMLNLKTAKSYFIPTVNLSASYVSAEGGRYADLPVGDMLNPVYSTLNQMIGMPAFPQIENQQINFLPNNYYDAYVRTSVPLLNMDLISNKKIQEQRLVLSDLDQQVYARELVKDIKVAYYQYIMAVKAVEVYQANLAVLEQNVALNKALVEQGKGLKVTLLKAETELLKTTSALSAAENQVKNAKAYFNFLLNKPLDSEIQVEETPIEDATVSSAKREELQLLEQAITVQESVLKMNKNYWIPKMNAFLDLGSQAQDWEWSRKSMYYMVGISASIPLYNGSRNQQQIKQTQLDIQERRLQIEQVTQQLTLQQEQAQRNVANALENWKTAQVQLEASKEYFALVSGANREGLTSQLEFIDASTQVTNAELFTLIQYQKYLTSLAELERAEASYPLTLN